ncbi:MAG: substrate-binding domain-containing protein, partial [Candidatus Lutibacillus vidarii]
DRLGVGDEAWQGVAVQELDAATLAARPLVDIVGPGGAIVCASDALAAGVWRAVHERGLRPGLDVGIVGFDDTDAARVLGLTTLRQPLTEITERVLAILLTGQTPPAAGTVLQAELVRRSSSSRTVIPPAR